MKNGVSPAVVGVSVVVVIAIIVLIGFKVLGKSSVQAGPKDSATAAMHDAYLKSVKDGTPRPGLQHDASNRTAPVTTGN